MYSLDELLGLFDLNYNMTLEDLKRAKKSVLMLHPDKSKLEPDYFLFYKKAFDIIVEFFENNNKANRPVTDENSQYLPLDSNYNKATSNTVKTMVNEMPKNEFQNKFNQLFEENMVNKLDANKNDWFKTEEPIFKTTENVSSKNMGKIFDQFKEQNSDIVRYTGVQNMMYSNSGSQLYDDVDEDEYRQSYISSNPFSKLKFDDLRKVHKDQTIFAVSDKKYKQYSSLDDYNRERSKTMGSPLEKAEAEKFLADQEKHFREKMLQKQHTSQMKTREYEEKNKAILSTFLRLNN
jgi:hypothetical protein